MKELLILITLFVFYSTFFIKQIFAIYSPVADVYQLTSGFYREDWPMIYGKKVYWTDSRGGVYGYDFNEKKEFLLVNSNMLTNFYAAIGYDGRYLVYNSYDGVSYDVNVYDTENKLNIPVTTGEGSKFATDYDQGKIVYLDGGASAKLYLFNLRHKVKILITDKASQPKISGRYIVWYHGLPNGLNEIYGYDLVKEKYIDIPNPEGADRGSPDINGHKIVYVYSKNGINSIRLFNILTQEEKILQETSIFNMSWPSISKRYVVWGKNTAQDISGVEGYDLLSKQIFEIQEQGQHQNDNMSPIVEGNIAAWMAWRTNNGDIYGAIIHH